MSVLQDDDEFPEFCETTIAKSIRTTVNHVRQLGFNAVIIGPPGVGKTLSLKHYAAGFAGAYMFTASASIGKAARLIFRQLCDALRVGDGGGFADIQQRLFKYDLSGRAIIIDEAQNLNLQGIRELLYLSDLARMSVVFCGNEQVLKRATVNTGPFAQIGSRIPYRTELPSLQPEDADVIANSFGVEGVDAYALMRAVAEHHQARGVSCVLQAARVLVGSGKVIKAAHIREIFDRFPQYRPVQRKR